MSFDFNEAAVLWTYRNAHRDKDNPTVDDLDRWDSTLGTRYEKHLNEKMPQFAIVLTRENKSRIVALAEVSNGTSPAVRVEDACRFFNAAWKLPLGEAAPLAESAAISGRAARPRRRRTKRRSGRG